MAGPLTYTIGLATRCEPRAQCPLQHKSSVGIPRRPVGGPQQRLPRQDSSSDTLTSQRAAVLLVAAQRPDHSERAWRYRARQHPASILWRQVPECVRRCPLRLYRTRFPEVLCTALPRDCGRRQSECESGRAWSFLVGQSCPSRQLSKLTGGLISSRKPSAVAESVSMSEI